MARNSSIFSGPLGALAHSRLTQPANRIEGLLPHRWQPAPALDYLTDDCEFMEEIYVRLLNEGTEVYRPVPAQRIGSSVYLIDHRAPYDTADESWEFPPGSRVQVTQRLLSGEIKLVATRLDP
jgi:hypothetical protein